MDLCASSVDCRGVTETPTAPQTHQHYSLPDSPHTASRPDDGSHNSTGRVVDRAPGISVSKSWITDPAHRTTGGPPAPSTTTVDRSLTDDTSTWVRPTPSTTSLTGRYSRLGIDDPSAFRGSHELPLTDTPTVDDPSAYQRVVGNLKEAFGRRSEIEDRKWKMGATESDCTVHIPGLFIAHSDNPDRHRQQRGLFYFVDSIGLYCSREAPTETMLHCWLVPLNLESLPLLSMPDTLCYQE